MKAVLQRVTSARVRVDGSVVGEIGRGILVLLGATHDDGTEDVVRLVDKTLGLRIFEDDQGKMNLSVQDVGGSLLVVSQFTLLADTTKGKRPSFQQAMEPGRANELVEEFVAAVKGEGVPVATGKFGADMDVELLNQGPVTIILDSRERRARR